MKVFVLLFAAVAVISAAPTDTEVPDYYEAHAEAQQTIDQLLQDGKDDSACRDLAKETIKDIKTTVETSQKTYDSVDKGFNCHKEGQDAVMKAKEQKSFAEKKFKDATAARKAACSASVTFAPRAYNSLKENECSTFFSDAAYVAAKKKCSDSKTAEAKAEGEVTAATKALKSAEEAAAKAVAACECKTHKANKAAFEAATKNNEANKKAWTKAHHMLCVLDGIAPSKCVHLSAPFVAKAPVCTKCDGSTCVKEEPLSCAVVTKKSNDAGVVKPSVKSGYTLTGGGMINHYRSWDKKSAFEQMYPDGNQYNCDTGFGAGKLTCYAISCKRGSTPLSCKTSSKRFSASGVTTVQAASGYVMTGGGLYNHYRNFDKKALVERSHPNGNGWSGDTGAGVGDYTTYVRGCKGVECVTKISARGNAHSVSCPSGYKVTGCGIINYKGWGKTGGFEDTHPSGQGCSCDSGFGTGDMQCYARCCK
jgi:chemotaxis protein histidine kinase CheA